MADTLTCPVCGSADARRVEEARWRCNACDTLWRMDGSVPVVEIAGTPVRDPGARGLLVPAAAGVALVALLGGLLWLAWPEPPPPPGPPPGEVTRKILDRSAIQRHPEIELPATREGVDAEGRTFWLVTYRNLDEVPIARPTVVASLYDAQGKLLSSPEGKSLLPELGPSEDTVVLVRSDVGEFHHAEVLATTPVVARQEPTLVRVGVDRLEVRKPKDRAVLEGSLLNLVSQQVRVTRVEAVGRTVHGDPVAFARFDPVELILGPDDREPITLPVGDLLVETPTYWTGYAVAEPL
ncbi:MAG: hypothetical protein H6732_17125 [Alphaproteobacteria bacterium]|nr:hypothetical protein [Alphaproteobacteria bacterium]